MNKSYVIPPAKREAVMRAAMAVGKFWTDELDCKKSLARQKTDKTPEEVLQMGLAGPKTFWTFILRFNTSWGGNRNYADVGLSTMTQPDYFLWIELSIDAADKLIEQFKLKEQT